MDIVVIGGGPAGRTAAIEASSIGENVTLIERDKIGGTCLNEGCVIVTGLNDVAKFIRDAQNFKNLGLINYDYQLYFDNVINGIRETVAKIRHILEIETKDAGVEIDRGNARLENNKVILDNKEIEYDKLIIATGARPFVPQIEGFENAITYKDILNLTELPEELIIIGSGVIAAEFANVFSGFGTKVNVLCRNKFLGMLDEDIKKYVTENLLPDITIHENLSVNTIHKDGISTGNGEMNGLVFFATGMVPNSEVVSNLVDLGERKNIIVNKRMQTSNEDIYAAGDVTGGIGTTPVARAEGVTAARNACGIFKEMDYRFIPGAISLQQDVAFINAQNKTDGINGHMKGSAGPGSFWRVHDGKTGFTKMNIGEDGNINEIFSVSPSSRTSMAYMSKLLREGQKVEDFDDFMEVHPSTDAIYKLLRFFARFE
ncbi:FAD-dependent oxidoreductase [Methanobacterium sp.]|uniref:FAD-dependent oxidoreductase n=1 Tax=Methanobacterium sp. TaxID=2164 RepID=UPI003C71E6B3